MMLERLDYFPVEFPRVRPFKIATGMSNTAPNVLVRLEWEEGLVGWGNACPNSVTRETAESIMAVLEKARSVLVGQDICSPSAGFGLLDRSISGNPSAKAGVDIALYDSFGKFGGLSVCDFLGRKKDRLLTSMTIGIMDHEETVQAALWHTEDGFRVLKLKVGLDLEEDIRRVLSVRDAVGEDVDIRLDANQGYDAEQTLAFADAVVGTDIEYMEQPVPADDFGALKRVVETSPIPIMADETVKSLADVERVAECGCRLINVKLMKSGGITPGLKLAEAAAGHGIRAQVGCMGECRVSVTAGLHFALAVENVAYADLDSHFGIIDDITEGGLTLEDGILVPVDGAGLGIRVDKKYA